MVVASETITRVRTVNTFAHSNSHAHMSLSFPIVPLWWCKYQYVLMDVCSLWEKFCQDSELLVMQDAMATLSAALVHNPHAVFVAHLLKEQYRKEESQADASTNNVRRLVVW